VSRRILGVDPGSRITGFGVIDLIGQQRHYVASGCIRTPQGAPLAERIKVIIDGLFGVIDTYQPHGGGHRAGVRQRQSGGHADAGPGAWRRVALVLRNLAVSTTPPCR
jgi:crossover junction endodeoxyribonuclease RuvC